MESNPLFEQSTTRSTGSKSQIGSFSGRGGSVGDSVGGSVGGLVGSSGSP